MKVDKSLCSGVLYIINPYQLIKLFLLRSVDSRFDFESNLELLCDFDFKPNLELLCGLQGQFSRLLTSLNNSISTRRLEAP